MLNPCSMQSSNQGCQGDRTHNVSYHLANDVFLLLICYQQVMSCISTFSNSPCTIYMAIHSRKQCFTLPPFLFLHIPVHIVIHFTISSQYRLHYFWNYNRICSHHFEGFITDYTSLVTIIT
jgi:hypothetical protein